MAWIQVRRVKLLVNPQSRALSTIPNEWFTLNQSVPQMKIKGPLPKWKQQKTVNSIARKGLDYLRKRYKSKEKIDEVKFKLTEAIHSQSMNESPSMQSHMKPELLSKLHRTLGLFEVTTKKLNQADSSFNNAFNVLKTSMHGDDQIVDRASILCDIASVNILKKNYDEAEKSLKRAAYHIGNAYKQNYAMKTILTLTFSELNIHTKKYEKAAEDLVKIDRYLSSLPKANSQNQNNGQDNSTVNSVNSVNSEKVRSYGATMNLKDYRGIDMDFFYLIQKAKLHIMEGKENESKRYVDLLTERYITDKKVVCNREKYKLMAHQITQLHINYLYRFALEVPDLYKDYAKKKKIENDIESKEGVLKFKYKFKYFPNYQHVYEERLGNVSRTFYYPTTLFFGSFLEHLCTTGKERSNKRSFKKKVPRN